MAGKKKKKKTQAVQRQRNLKTKDKINHNAQVPWVRFRTEFRTEITEAAHQLNDISKVLRI